MKVEVLPDPGAVATRAAGLIAAEARAAVEARGRFAFAVSGGQTPWQMLRALAGEEVPWAGVHLFQVDERVAPAGDADRNLSHIRESLLGRAPLPPANVHAMPVEEGDLAAAAARYATELEAVAGLPPALDLVHLGLGPDGHTASLIPGDPVLQVAGTDVALAGPYQGRRRMTLTYPALDRARFRLWVVTGAEKAPVVPRLLTGDPSIPAGRVRAGAALLVLDAAAAAALMGGRA
ncbi:MAG TPA: 6-phosphogluconolactonase [Anaeromyxobacteraceae bacterium]|nr:6-phosphogluconolactonase [Anaeromyxobacteraceae bacterium]